MMLPALEHRPNPQSNRIDQLKDQLDFASRDIQEERRERLRMREQLSIQNEIINKLYTRLNQLEEEQADSSKVVNSILQSSLLQQQIETRKQTKLEKNADVDKIKDKFKQLSTSTREETEQIKKLSNDTHSTLLNVQEYLSALHQTEQNNGTRVTTLETNTNAAMECIKSLQSATTRLQNKISSVESVTSERDQEVAGSLQDIANCVTEAKTERAQLHDLINNSSLKLSQMKQGLDGKIQKSRQDIELGREQKDREITQSLEELTQCYRNVDTKIADEIALSFHDTKILITALQSSIVKEKSSRLEWEQKLRRDTANVLNNLRQNLRDQMGQYISVYEENKEKVDSSIKQLYKSIKLIEQSGDATKHGIEHILQAEIKTRVSKFKELEEHLNTVRSALGALDDRREEDAKRVKDEMLSKIEEFDRSAREEIKSLSDTVGGLQDSASSQIVKVEEEINVRITKMEVNFSEQLAKEIQETQEQIEVVTETVVEDRARKLEESLELLNNNYDTLETVLRTECDNRKSDLSTIHAEIAVKQDKLSHEKEMNTIRSELSSSNNNVYEVEEKMTIIEANCEESLKNLSDQVEAIQNQLKELTDSTVGDQIATLIDEVEGAKDLINKLQKSKTPNNQSPTSSADSPLKSLENGPSIQPKLPIITPPSPPKPAETPDNNSVTLIPEQL